MEMEWSPCFPVFSIKFWSNPGNIHDQHLNKLKGLKVAKTDQMADRHNGYE